MVSPVPFLKKPLSSASITPLPSSPPLFDIKCSPLFFSVALTFIRHPLLSCHRLSLSLSKLSPETKNLKIPLAAHISNLAPLEEFQVQEEREDASNYRNQKPGGHDFDEEDEKFPEPTVETKLFIGNLPYDFDNEKLVSIFETAGYVDCAEVIFNRVTGKSRRFGFVTMATVEEAEKAVEMFHRSDLGGQVLKVYMVAPRVRQKHRAGKYNNHINSVFVSNLSCDVDHRRLRQLCSKYGKVLHARIIYERDMNRHRGFGFVSMSTHTEMNAVITALDGHNLDGRILRVKVNEVFGNKITL